MAKIETLNQVQAAIEEPISINATVEETPVINLSLSNPIYRGPAGPAGPEGPVGAPGPRGEPGVPGVYMGDEAPTDSSIKVWVVPSATGTTYPTTAEVQQMINDALGVIENGSY